MMKQILRFSAVCLISLWLVSCGRTEENTVSLDMSVKNGATAVSSIEQIPLPEEFIAARKYYVYRDSLLIVWNRKLSDGYFLQFYDLSTGKLVRNCFRYGNGPEEALWVNAYLRGNTLLVNDMEKEQYCVINMDSIRDNRYSLPRFKKLASGISTISQFKGGKILIENPYCFDSDEADIHYSDPRFLVSEPVSRSPIPHKGHRYNTINVATSGHILYTTDWSRIVYASMNNPVIELYDSTLQLQKRIEGPDKLPIRYHNDGSSVSYKKRIPYAYLGCTGDDDGFYLSYVGGFYHKKMQNFDSYIFYFDWSGNLQGSYALNRYVDCLSLSTEPRVLYGTAYDEEDNPILVKIKL